LAVQSFPKDKNQQVEHLNVPYARVIVPNLIGLNNIVAQIELDGQGLRADEKYFVDTSGTGGVVIAQAVPAGKRIRFKTKIEYTVRTLSAVTTPYVVGQTKNSAIATITSSLLTYNLVTASTPDSTKQDIVIGQSPEPPIQLAPGATVTIVVGNYVPATEGILPDVTSKTESEAILALNVAGFTTISVTNSVGSTPSYQTLNGKIIAQTPVGGVLQSFTTTVSLTKAVYQPTPPPPPPPPPPPIIATPPPPIIATPPPPIIATPPPPIIAVPPIIATPPPIIAVPPIIATPPPIIATPPPIIATPPPIIATPPPIIATPPPIIATPPPSCTPGAVCGESIVPCGSSGCTCCPEGCTRLRRYTSTCACVNSGGLLC
jgi:beta-lactam-binding protein with PASTA domain